MMSKIPVDLGKLDGRERKLEIMRTAMIAELDAIDLYEQLAASTDDVNLKKVLLGVAREEKTHFGELQTMLLRLDNEQVKELDKAKEEVKKELEDK